MGVGAWGMGMGWRAPLGGETVAETLRRSREL